MNRPTLPAKHLLPTVQVKMGKAIRRGEVRGRLNPFASVWVEVEGVSVCAEFSWKAVERAVATGRPLVW